MAYVDLNPIRAGMAQNLENFDYTAIQSIIEAIGGQPNQPPLVAFEDEDETDQTALPYYLCHYLELVDWTGRAIRNESSCTIPPSIEPILDRMGFDECTWLEGINLFARPMFQVIGPGNKMRQAAKVNQRHWYRGITACRAVFGPT
jgi:hypothetical protein